MLSIEVLNIIAIFLVVFSLLYFQKTNNMVPLLISFSFFSSGISRYYAVAVNRTTGYVRVAGWDVFVMSDELALICLNLFCLGAFSLIFFLVTIEFYKKKKVVKKVDTGDLFRKFVNKNRVFIILLSFSYFVMLALRNVLYSISFSYGFYAPFASIGSIICIFFIIQSFNKINYIFIAIFFISYLLLIAQLAVTTHTRFSLLGWIIPIGFAILYKIKPGLKLVALLGGGAVAFIGFSILGELRSSVGKSFGELVTQATQRILISEDSNMLDGFMMMYQVVPSKLDFQYGLNHIEILTRPIPRSIWPNKPSGGYINKLNLNTGGDLEFIGISESMFGTFYVEGGVFGIVFFCFFYALLLSRLLNYFARYEGMLGATLQGCVYASLLAWFRGGDFAGIFALLLLSYWPVIIFMRRYNSFLKLERRREYYNSLMQQDLEQKLAENQILMPLKPILHSI